MHSGTLTQHRIGTPASLTPHPSPFRCPIALSSYHPNPTHESSAPRRCLAAGGGTQQLPAVQPAVSRADRWPHCRAVIVAERRAYRPQQHALASQRRRAAQDVRTPTVPWSPCPCLPSASACPASTRPASTRPASGVRCVSSVRLSGRASSVARPVSNARCPCPVSSVPCRRRVSGCPVRRPAFVRVASVSALSAPVSSWSARGAVAATRLGTGRGRRVTPLCLRPDLNLGPALSGIIKP